jgi:hypothetical protein
MDIFSIVIGILPMFAFAVPFAIVGVVARAALRKRLGKFF